MQKVKLGLQKPSKICLIYRKPGKKNRHPTYRSKLGNPRIRWLNTNNRLKMIIDFPLGFKISAHVYIGLSRIGYAILKWLKSNNLKLLFPQSSQDWIKVCQLRMVIYGSVCLKKRWNTLLTGPRRSFPRPFLPEHLRRDPLSEPSKHHKNNFRCM